VEFESDHENNLGAFDAYGALVEGRAVCQGYAHAFKLLLHFAGVENVIVTGRAGGVNHAWNLVNFGTKTNERWYHVDVTWNDRDDADSNRYFALSDYVIGSSHTWERGYFPAATSMQYNYFRFTGRTASTSNELEHIFDTAFSRGEDFIEILCAFPVRDDDLGFLWQRYTLPSVNYAIDGYGSDYLLTLKIPPASS